MPNKPQFTPGPWQLFYMPFSDSDNGIDLKGNNGNTLIANFPTPVKTEGIAFTPSDEDAANLKLIALAPEMFAALGKAEYCLDFDNREIVSAEDLHRTLSEIRSILAKLNS